jgi:hypothetical protein
MIMFPSAGDIFSEGSNKNSLSEDGQRKQRFKKNLFGNKKDERFERLVRRLIFYQDENTFLDALREATALAPQGNDLGVRALSEAIRRRCGNRFVDFFSPSFDGLIMRSIEELFQAEGRLLELAKSGKLLDDPSITQNLISAALYISQDGLNGLLKSIFILAGVEHGYDFQLLFNQMHSSIKLRHANGERSWTQQMNDEIP